MGTMWILEMSMADDASGHTANVYGVVEVLFGRGERRCTYSVRILKCGDEGEGVAEVLLFLGGILRIG